jgi:hypothetical protein
LLISNDRSAELIEILWEAGEHFGVHLSVADRAAIANDLSIRRPETITRPDVNQAFRRRGLATPSATYTNAILRKVRRIAPGPSLRDVLVEFRQFAIASLSGQFGGKTAGREEELRNYVLTYLPKRGYTEARTGKGRSDILVPPPTNAIIETKVWRSPREYEDGLVELGRYIHTENPDAAFMVLFCDREPLPSIVRDHRQAIAEERRLEGLLVPVVVVPFEVDQPSKAGAQARRRERHGR